MRFRSRSIQVLMALTLLTMLAVPAQTLADAFSERYDAGVELFENGRYNSAIRHFRVMLADNSQSSLSDNCQYWIGESYYAMKLYEQAMVEFDRVFTFPRSNKNEDAMFKIAQCHERLGEMDLAREMYLRFVAQFPASRHVQLVMKKIREIESAP